MHEAMLLRFLHARPFTQPVAIERGRTDHVLTSILPAPWQAV